MRINQFQKAILVFEEIAKQRFKITTMSEQ